MFGEYRMQFVKTRYLIAAALHDTYQFWLLMQIGWGATDFSDEQRDYAAGFANRTQAILRSLAAQVRKSQRGRGVEVGRGRGRTGGGGGRGRGVRRWWGGVRDTGIFVPDVSDFLFFGSFGPVVAEVSSRKSRVRILLALLIRIGQSASESDGSGGFLRPHVIALENSWTTCL